MSVTAALDAIERMAVLCWLATADGRGQPSVSPKEVFAVIGPGRLAIAHIASPRSVSDIGANPRVCVSFVDVFVQKGWKLAGSARVVRAADAGFDEVAAPLVRRAGPAFRVRAAIVVTVDAATPILAPSYLLHGDGDEQERLQVRQARRTYLARLRQLAASRRA